MSLPGHHIHHLSWHPKSSSKFPAKRVCVSSVSVVCGGGLYMWYVYVVCACGVYGECLCDYI